MSTARQVSSVLQPGAVLGKYKLVRALGEGTQGVVFEAENQSTGRRVALKILHPDLVRHPQTVARFLQEARISTRIAHPNILEVLDLEPAGEGGWIYIVSELLRGESLRELLTQNGRLGLRDALETLVPIMSALLAAHTAGVIHRDLKPENIFLSRAPHRPPVPKLMDFGVSKVLHEEGKPFRTRAGVLIGTPEYMAPEQLRGDDEVDVAVDVWSMGVVLYECLTGQCPFAAPGLNQVMVRVTMERPPRVDALVPEVPVAVADVIATAMQPERKDRYPSMARMLGALLEAANLRSHEAPREEPSAANSLPSARPPALEDEAHRSSIDAEEELLELEQSLLLELPEEPEPAPRDSSIALAVPAAVRRDAGEVVAEDGVDALRQAVFENWGGLPPRAERYSSLALAMLPRASPEWYEAVGENARASSRCGRNERLSALADTLTQLRSEGAGGASFLVAAYRLAIELGLVGANSVGLRLIGALTAEVDQLMTSETRLRAYFRRYVGLQLELAGDLGTAIHVHQLAETDFLCMGDVATAVLERLNVGNDLIELGDYDRARYLLQAVAGDVARMTGRSVNTLIHLHLARAHLFAGALEAAALHLGSAQELLARGNRGRLLATARTYAAMLALARKDAEEAENLALQASDPACRTPPVRALAFAVLCEARLARGRAEEALEAARQGYELMESLGGIAEGEARVRLAYARALAAAGRLVPACSSIRVARARLHARAEALTAPRWRASFLGRVRENADTLSLASRWLEETPGSG